MNIAAYHLGMKCGSAARRLFVPVALFAIWLCRRTDVVDGATFIEFDSLTIAGLIAALILALISLYWWFECGDGWLDVIKIFVLCGPLLAMVTFLDPLGQGMVIGR